MGCCGCKKGYSRVVADDDDTGEPQAPLPASDPCDNAGMMKMKVNAEADWVSNWFALRGLLLYVYTSETDEAQVDCISLSGCMCMVHEDDEDDEDRLLSYMFEISSYTDDRLFALFEVESEQLLYDWITKISASTLSNSNENYSLDDCYSTLGVPPGSPFKKVKISYYKISRKAHPDKVR